MAAMFSTNILLTTYTLLVTHTAYLVNQNFLDRSNIVYVIDKIRGRALWDLFATRAVYQLLISSSKCQNRSGDISEMMQKDVKDAVEIVHSTDTTEYHY